MARHYSSLYQKTNRLTSDLGLDYDYASVMHYGPRAFTVDASLPTIIPRVAGVEIGQRRGFSQVGRGAKRSRLTCACLRDEAEGRERQLFSRMKKSTSKYTKMLR